MDESERIIDVEPRRRLPAFLTKRTPLEWLLLVLAVGALFFRTNADPSDDYKADILDAVAEELRPVKQQLATIEQTGAAAVDPAYLSSLSDDVDQLVELTADNARLRTQLDTEIALRANLERSTETELRALRSDLMNVRTDYADATTLIATLQQQQENPDEDRICLSSAESAAYRVYLDRRDELRGD